MGAAVRQLRHDRGWTLEDLSEKTDISVSGLSLLENGKTQRVRRENVTRLAAAFDVSEDELDPRCCGERVAAEAKTLHQRRLVHKILSLTEEEAAEANRIVAEIAKRRRRRRTK